MYRSELQNRIELDVTSGRGYENRVRISKDILGDCEVAVQLTLARMDYLDEKMYRNQMNYVGQLFQKIERTFSRAGLPLSLINNPDDFVLVFESMRPKFNILNVFNGSLGKDACLPRRDSFYDTMMFRFDLLFSKDDFALT